MFRSLGLRGPRGFQGLGCRVYRLWGLGLRVSWVLGLHGV